MSENNFNRRQLLQMLGAGTLALGSGLPAAAFAQSSSTGPLRVAVLGAIPNLHPWQVTNIEISGLVNLLYSNLVSIAPDGSIVPDVARALPTVSADGLINTFDLRDDVHFHNGDKLTAHDVLYTWQQVMQSARRKETYKDFIKDIIVENDYRIRFEFKRPNAGWLYGLAYDAGIVRSGTNVTNNKAGAQNLFLGSNEACSGPYILKKFEPDTVIEFEAFPGYFGGAPAQKQIIAQRIPDSSAQLAALLAGSIDIVSSVPPKDFGPTMKQPGIKGGTRVTSGIFWAPLNRQQAPFDNVHLRRALSCAIDREYICNELYYGVVTPTSIPAVPGEFWYDEALAKQLAFDPEKAKFHLKQGGHADGFEFEAMIPVPSTYIDIAEAAVFMQANFAEVGIKMNIRQIDFTAMFAAARAGNFQAFPNVSMQYSIEDALVYNAYTCNGSQASFNHHCVADFDTDVSKAAISLLPDVKKAPMSKVLAHLVEDATSLWIGRPSAYNLWSDKVAGYQPSTMAQLNLAKTVKA